MGFEEDMMRLKQKMKQLETEYEQWFSGALPVPPWETQKYIENIIKFYNRNPPNGLAEQSTKDVTLGSFCTVFAATEILEKIRTGHRVEDIVKGAFRSVVKRLVEMDAVDGALVMTGGVVAHNRLLTELVGEAFGTPARMPPDPQYIGAFGAALFAVEQDEKGDS